MLLCIKSLKFFIPILSIFFIFIETSQSESFVNHFKFPPLNRVPTSDVSYNYLQNAMVMKRLAQIPVKLSDILELEKYTNDISNQLKKTALIWPTEYKRIIFNGEKFSELNTLIKKLDESNVLIELSNSDIEVDETLTLANNIFIDGNNIKVLANDLKPSILVDGVSNTGLKNMVFEQPHYAIQVINSKNAVFSQLEMNQPKVGVTVSSGSHFLLFDQLKITKTQKSAFVIQGDNQYIGLLNSHITLGQSANNEAAAVLISDVVIPENQLYLTLTEHSSVFYQPILSGQPIPHHILIENNSLDYNLSQGIYLDGVSGVVIRGNDIHHNDKEGICLDFGASNNIVENNSIHSNGNRAFQADTDLKRDLIYGFGKMADGSARAKLPGISLDNAAQNVIIKNSITNSAGDGIKIVRSGFRNIFMFNSIIDNNQGQNSRFHFFGILLGSADAEPEVKLSPNKVLDFFPSIENIVMGNMIYGQHYASVMLDKGAAYNDIYDNIARQYKQMPIEKVSHAFNSDVGNSWNNEKQSKLTYFFKQVFDYL